MTKTERELFKKLTDRVLALPKDQQQYILGYAAGAAAVAEQNGKEDENEDH